MSSLWFVLLSNRRAVAVPMAGWGRVPTVVQAILKVAMSRTTLGKIVSELEKAPAAAARRHNNSGGSSKPPLPPRSA